MDPDQLLSEKEAAALLSFSRPLLRAWRRRGEGPPFFRAARAIRYRRADLLEFVASHITREPGEPRNPTGAGGRPAKRRRRS